MKEKAIASSIMKWLNEQRFTAAWKINDFNNVGFPDVVGCHRGRFFSLEIKSKYGKTTPKQDYEAFRISKALGKSAVVRSLSDVKGYFMAWFGHEEVKKQ